MPTQPTVVIESDHEIPHRVAPDTGPRVQRVQVTREVTTGRRFEVRHWFDAGRLHHVDAQELH